MPLQGNVLVSGAGTLTLTNANSVFVFSGSAAAAWTMPALAGNTGEILWLFNRGTAAVTVTRAGSNQFYNAGSLVTSVTLPPGGELQIMNDGTYWLVMTGGGGQLVDFDNAAQSADHQGATVASGAATTWTHAVAAANSYGLVRITCESVLSTVTAVVTMGGVTLAPLTPNANGFWLFGGPGIPAGSQTVSVTLSGHTCLYTAFSYTYTRVAAVGVAAISPVGAIAPFDANELPMVVPRTSPNPGRIWCGAVSGSNYPAGLSYFKRQQHNPGSGLLRTVDGDVGVAGPEPLELVSYWDKNDVPTTLIALAAVELLGTVPVGPYLTSKAASDASVANTWAHCVAPGTAYLFVIISSYPRNTLASVTCGGVAMTRLASVDYNGDATGASGTGVLFGLASPAAGVQTISLGTPANPWSAGSFGYHQLTTVSTPALATGTTANMTQTAAALYGQVIFQFFGTASAGPPVETDAYTPLLSNALGGGGSSGQGGLNVNQSIAASATFTASSFAFGSLSAQPWGAMSMVLS